MANHNQEPINLREITQETLYPILKLDVAEEQRCFVAPNARSIAEAYYSKEAWFRGIFKGDQPVGFVMLYANTDKPKYLLWRLMIDEGHQGKGYGFQAMQQVIEYVRTLPNAVELLASYMPGEGDPSPFYYKLGFEETGEMLGNENVLRLKLS